MIEQSCSFFPQYFGIVIITINNRHATHLLIQITNVYTTTIPAIYGADSG